MKEILLHIRRKLISGIFILVPLIITYFVISFMFGLVDSLFAAHINRLIEKFFGAKVPAVGIMLSIIIVYLIGLFGSNVIIKKLITYGEKLLIKIPLIKEIYSSSKQLVDALSTTSAAAFRQVVYIEYPHKGILAIGFLTNEFKDANGKEYCSVFMPTTPNPTSGFLMFYPKEQVILSNITVDEAFKAIMSGALVFQGVLPTGEPKSTSQT